MVLVNKDCHIEPSPLESNILINPSVSADISNKNSSNHLPAHLNLVKSIDLSNYFYSPSSKFKNDLLVRTLKTHHQAFTTSSPNSSSDCNNSTTTSNPSSFNKSVIKSTFNEISTTEIETTNNITTDDSASKKSATSILFSHSGHSDHSSSPSLISSNTSSNCASNSLTSSSSSFVLTNSASSYNSNSPLTLSSSSSNPPSPKQTITFKPILVPSTKIANLTNLDFRTMMMMFGNNQNNNNNNNNNNNLQLMGSSNSPSGNGNLIMQQLTNINTINNSNLSNNSDEHEELLAEMELIERLPTQERLKQAKRRRALQLKKWNEYEKDLQENTFSTGPSYNNYEKSNNKNLKQFIQNNNPTFLPNQSYNFKRSIKFQDHIVLLDAIMRKDCDEIERLLDSGVTPNSANEDGLTAIHQVLLF
jgi:hypothetical protein